MRKNFYFLKLFIMLLSFSQIVYAEEARIGAYVYPNIGWGSGINWEDYLESTDMNMSGKGSVAPGIFIEIPITKGLSFQPEMQFMVSGDKGDTTFGESSLNVT